MNVTRSIVALAVISAILCAALPAQDKAPGGFRGEFLVQMKDVEKKIIDLAGAFPEKVYAWRPAKGVRSTSEVLMHVVGGNYMFPSIAGVKSTTTIGADMERTVTAKEKVLDYLHASFDHLRKAVAEMKEEDLERQVTMFGARTTVRNVYFTAALHLHEHLGQAVAYARMNNVVPPWTGAGK